MSFSNQKDVGNYVFAPVSVVLPCYRCSKTIGRAIESVVKQTLLPKELILIDDASDDDEITIKILYEQAAKYADILIVKIIALDQNKGAGNARNMGWNLATQSYIALLDADDAWHPRKIEIQYNVMEKNPKVILSGHDAKIVKKNTFPDWELYGSSFKNITKENLLVKNPFTTPSVMIRKEMPLRFEPSKRYVDDHLLWLKMAYEGYEIVKIDQPLVAIYKPMFGSTGLSSNLWLMEKSELDNYMLLYKDKRINLFTLSLLLIYSLLKYFRRILICKFR